MRLIDADELKKAITDATYNFEQIPIRVDKVQEIIDNAPTVNKCDNCDLMFLGKTRGDKNAL